MLFFVVVLIKNKNNGEIKMENLIGKKVKLTKEFATEYYYDKPYVDKILRVIIDIYGAFL